MSDFYITVIEFVNDSSKESLRILLDKEFTEFGMIILHTLFKAENNNLDVLLTVMAEHMNSAELVKLSVDLLKEMVESDQADILCVFWPEAIELFDTIIDSCEDRETLKDVHICQKKIRFLKDRVTPERISLKLLRRTRCWRRYTKDELTSLRLNPEVECWHFAEIVLDWINSSYTVTQGKSYSHVLQNVENLRDLVFKDLDSKLEEADLTTAWYDYMDQVKNKFREDTGQSTRLIFIHLNQICKQINFKGIGSHGPRVLARQIICLIIRILVIGLLLLVLTVLVITPNHRDIERFVLSYAKTIQKTINGELPGEMLFVGLVKMMLLEVMIFCLLALGFPFRQVLPGKKLGIKLAFREHEIFLLAKAATLKLSPYYGSIFRFFPYRAKVKILNEDGMRNFEIKNAQYAEKDYRICHTFISHRESNSSRNIFYSLFTHTYGEVLNFLNEKCQKDIEQRNEEKKPSISFSHYFEKSKLEICTLLR